MAYYAVLVPTPQVFDNWSDCDKYLKEYVEACKQAQKDKGDKKEGCLTVYRKFDTEEIAHAHAFRATKTPESGDLVAYTDGDYNPENNECGSGIVLVKDDVVQDELSFSGPNTFGARNITGEANAVIRLLEYCVENGIKRIFIVHDLIHLAELVREHGFFEADSAATLDYQKRYRELVDKHQLKVYFNWVKGHGDNQWNDRADRLAGLASGKYKGDQR